MKPVPYTTPRQLKAGLLYLASVSKPWFLEPTDRHFYTSSSVAPGLARILASSEHEPTSQGPVQPPKGPEQLYPKLRVVQGTQVPNPRPAPQGSLQDQMDALQRTVEGLQDSLDLLHRMGEQLVGLLRSGAVVPANGDAGPMGYSGHCIGEE